MKIWGQKPMDVEFKARLIGNLKQKYPKGSDVIIDLRVALIIGWIGSLTDK